MLLCWNSKNGKKIIVPTQFLRNNESISLKLGHICALKTDATYACWDFRDEIDIPRLKNVKSVSAGYKHNCVTFQNNDLECYDENLGTLKVDVVPEDLLMGTKAAEVGEF